MIRPPPRSTRTDTLFPYTTLFRSVLRAEQHSLSVRFATAAADKWNGIPYDLWPGDLPVLRGCLASLACRREAVHEGGDHVIVVGRVAQIESGGSGDPLIYFQSGYRTHGPRVGISLQAMPSRARVAANADQTAP